MSRVFEINKNLILFMMFTLFLLSPFAVIAKEETSDGTVDPEKVKASIFDSIPSFIATPTQAVISKVENYRLDWNEKANAELLKIKSVSVVTPEKKEENKTSVVPQYSLGSQDQVLGTLKYYACYALAYITSIKWLFWAILLFLVFILIRLVLRIVF